MASKTLKIALVAILATFVLVGCGEKEPEYKIEGPKATDMKEVGGVASSGAAANNDPMSGASKGAPPSGPPTREGR